MQPFIPAEKFFIRRVVTFVLAPALATAGVTVLTATAARAIDAPDPVPIGCVSGGAGSTTCEFSDTTVRGSLKVPTGVTKIKVQLRGGGGGDGSGDDEPGDAPGGQGGAGGETTTTLTVSPGQVLHALVGAGAEDLGTGSCATEPPVGGVSGGFDGINASPLIAGGDGSELTGTWCTGGAGGGGTFLMKKDELPTDSVPLAAAGGGGGGGGGGINNGIAGTAGGKGGKGAQPGGGTNGGEVASGSEGTGESGGQGGSDGGGGGGGGYLGGGGGGAGSGGAGGCGVPETVPCPDNSSISPKTEPAVYRPAGLDGLVVITFTAADLPTGPGGGGGRTPPADIPTEPNPNGGGGPSSNDPNPNTNPATDPQPLEGMPANTDTALCKPEKKICTVSVSGPDSRFKIDAEDGQDTAVLFASMNGNWRPASVEAGGRPNCPDYAERNSDWVQFGFFEPARGKTWHKTGYMTQRQKMKKAAASAMAQKMQVCFAAPYKFPTRPGYRLGTQGADRVGVLAECGTVRGRNGRPVPCVTAREILKVKGGWVVRLTFRIPANGKDPKALG